MTPNGTTLRRIALLALLGVVLIVSGVRLLARRDVSPERVVPVARSDGAITSDPHSLDAHNSPTIAQDPNDHASLVVANKIDRPRFNSSLNRSDDGGETWSTVSFPAPDGEDRPYAPDLAWGSNGTLYMSFVTLTGRGNNPEAIWIASSDDGGEKWSTPQRIFGAYAFQVQLSVDAGDDDLYLTWLQAARDAVGTLSFVQTGLPIVAARSTDGGTTWSEPGRVSSLERERVGAAVGAVSPAGELYVLYLDFKDDRFDWENLEGGVYPGSFELVLAHGDETATTFEESVVEPNLVPYERFLIYLPKFPTIAFGPGDSVYAAWAAYAEDDSDVFVRRSDDGGNAWSERVMVSADTTEGQNQELPQIAVAPGGRVDVVYLERRQSGRRSTAVKFATTSDDGETWTRLELTSRRFRGDLGPEGVPGVVDQGTRLGLVTNDERAVAVWTDSRRGTPITGRLDIFAASVAFRS